MKIQQQLFKLIQMPQLYIAAVASALPGGVIGAIIGAVTGGGIEYHYPICPNCITEPLSLNMGLIGSSAIGAIAGALGGGAITGLTAIFMIWKRTQNYNSINNDQVGSLLLQSLVISLEICMGMVLGGIIGSLKFAGPGTIIGSTIGLLVIYIKFWKFGQDAFQNA